jgi:hypothetical protein
MIEHIPEKVESAFLYFHSAGASAEEIRSFHSLLIDSLPNTYIWAGDGVIGGSPLMRQGLRYGRDAERYWFTFPMQDASSPESFAGHIEAMGATLTCSGAYVNALVDQLLVRFRIPAQRVVLCGWQHGSCIALAASMIRIDDPYAFTILFEPYALETYYLRDELTVPKTNIVCIENQHMRTRTRNWLGIETDQVLNSYGIATQQITVPGSSDRLDALMMNEAISIMRQL